MDRGDEDRKTVETEQQHLTTIEEGEPRRDGGDGGGSDAALMEEMPVYMKTTLIYAMCFFTLGLLLAGLGPVVLEIMRRTGATDPEAGALFTVRALGYAVGSFAMAPLLQSFHDHANRIVALFLGAAGIGTIVFPFLTWQVWASGTGNVVAMGCALAVTGVAMGCMDSGCNVMLVWTFQNAPVPLDPWMQGLHAAFAVGAFLSPLIVNTLNLGLDASFWMFGFLLFPIAAVVWALPTPAALSEEQQGKHNARSEYAATLEGLLVLCGSVYLGFYVGAEVAAGGFLDTYGNLFAGIGHVQSSLVNSAYWGSFAAGRILSIYVSSQVSSGTILVYSTALAMVSALLPVVFPHSIPALWMCVLLYGFALAPCFPSMFNYCSENVVHLSASSASVLVVGASVGEMLIPFVISVLFELYGLGALFPGLSVTMGLGLVVLVGAFYVAALRQKEMQEVVPGADSGCDSATDVEAEMRSEAPHETKQALLTAPRLGAETVDR